MNKKEISSNSKPFNFLVEIFFSLLMVFSIHASINIESKDQVPPITITPIVRLSNSRKK